MAMPEIIYCKQFSFYGNRRSYKRIEVEKENLRNQISRFNEQLANQAAFLERLIRQVKKSWPERKRTCS